MKKERKEGNKGKGKQEDKNLKKERK